MHGGRRRADPRAFSRCGVGSRGRTRFGSDQGGARHGHPGNGASWERRVLGTARPGNAGVPPASSGGGLAIPFAGGTPASWKTRRSQDAVPKSVRERRDRREPHRAHAPPRTCLGSEPRALFVTFCGYSGWRSGGEIFSTPTETAFFRGLGSVREGCWRISPHGATCAWPRRPGNAGVPPATRAMHPEENAGETPAFPGRAGGHQCPAASRSA